MASGTLQVRVLSYDYSGGRGAMTLIGTIGWDVDAANVLRLTYQGSSGSTGWYVINTSTECWVELNGTRIGHSVKAPVNGDLVSSLLAELIGKLSPMQLTHGGSLIVAFGSTLAPAPTPSLPNAFPSVAISEGDQVAVIIPDLDYRPGSRWIDGMEHSCNRPGGANERRVGGTNVELRTTAGGIGNPPERRVGGQNRNQNRVGSE